MPRRSGLRLVRHEVEGGDEGGDGGVEVKKVEKVPAWRGIVTAAVIGVIILGTLGVTCYIQHFRKFSDDIVNFKKTSRHWADECLEPEYEKNSRK